MTRVIDRIHENQVGEILPYQFEPKPSTKTNDASDDNDTDQSDVTTSSGEDVDHELERANAWRLLDLILVGINAVIAHHPLRLLNVFVATGRRWSTTSANCKPRGTNYMQYWSPTLY